MKILSGLMVSLVVVILVTVIPAFVYAETIMPIGFKGKWGFVSESGNIVVKPQYEETWELEDGLAIIKKSGKYGYVDKKGKVVLEPKYEDVFCFSEGLAGVVVNKKIGFIDKKGNMVIEPKYDEAELFHNGIAAVAVNKKWGYIDKTGKYIFEPQFDYVSSFRDDGVTSARSGSTWSIIDNKGSKLFSVDKDLSGYNEGLATLEEDGKYGFIDKKGNWVIKPALEKFTRFIEGVAVVAINNKYGVIDKQGNFIVKPIYNQIDDFKEGLAHFEYFDSKGDGYNGFLNTKGEIAIKPEFAHAWMEFSGGIVPVALTQKDYWDTTWTYIDKTGKPVSPNKFTYRALSGNKAVGTIFKSAAGTAHNYKNGRFIGVLNNKIGYWNKSAKPIVMLEESCGDEYLVNGAGKIIWPTGFKPNKTCKGKSTKPLKSGANDYNIFRKGLKEGDNTHCGLVVEVKKKVVKIQTMIGEHWFKIDQLYPSGTADCKFINNVYQEP
jgi:hypothetical protein